MNNDNLLKIARAIYLQDIVSRQIFASIFDPNGIDQLINEGAMRAPQKLVTCFQGFVGSTERTPTVQFIKKQGMNFTIYKMNLTQASITNQVLITLPLQRISWFLTSLQSFISSNAGNDGILGAIKQLMKTASKNNDAVMKGNNGRALYKDKNDIIKEHIDLLNEQFYRFKGMADKLSKMISVKDIQFKNYVNQIELNINKQFFPNQDVINACDGILNMFENNSNVKKSLKSIGTNATRITMLSKIYNKVTQIIENSENQNQNLFANNIKTAIQSCNTNSQLENKDKQISNINLQDFWEKYPLIDRSYKDKETGEIDHQKQYELQNGVRFAHNSLISFLGGYSKTISYDVFQSATTQLMGTYGVEQKLYDKLSQLDDLCEWILNLDKTKYNRIKSFKKQENNKQIGTLYYSDFKQANPELMQQLKEIAEYL